MMRYSSLRHQNLYQKYSRLGKEIAKASKFSQEKESLNKIIWELISKEGIWGLSISEQYGGDGLSWQDFVVALDGLFTEYLDIALLSLFMPQISAIYLISHHAIDAIKSKYLPLLIKGDIAHFVVSKSINSSIFNDIDTDINKHQISFIERNKIIFYAEKMENKIALSINQKKYGLNHVVINKFCSHSVIQTTKSFLEINSQAAIQNFVHFKKLIYGSIAVIFMAPFIQRNIKQNLFKLEI